MLLLYFGLSWLADSLENWHKACGQDKPTQAGHLAEGSDEQAGHDGEKGAGDQLQEEAVEPDIELVQQEVIGLSKRTPLNWVRNNNPNYL